MKVGDLVELSARGMDLKESRHINWNRPTPGNRKSGRRRMIGIITEVVDGVVCWDSSLRAGYKVKWFDTALVGRFAYDRKHLKMAR